MPKGGIRPRRGDGSVAHLLQPKWNLGRTRTIRAKVVLADQLDIAHHISSDGSIDLTQDNIMKVRSAVISPDTRLMKTQ